VAPGELAVILGGVSAGQGQIRLVPLIAIVWACALAGDLTSFTIGRRLGSGYLLRHGPRFGVTAPRLQQAQEFFAAHGGKTIIVGRFIGFVRPLTPFIAGTSGMPARRFVVYTTFASGIWAATFSVLGYVFWHSLDQLLSVTKDGTVGLAVVVGLVVGGIVLYRRLRARSRPSSAPSRP
jgi:membrane protein DedA with SNARE-associated domain